MIHNPNRKPQTNKRTTQVRQQSDWQDYQSPGGILRGDRPVYDRECKKSQPVNSQFPALPSVSPAAE